MSSCDKEDYQGLFNCSENDIPGASLQGRKPESIHVSELKQWLKCRQGATLKGLKQDLIDRFAFHFNTYFERTEKLSI